MKHTVIRFYCLETSHGLVCSQQIFENVISSTKENTNDLKNQSAQKHIFTISERKRNLHVLIKRFDPVACLGLIRFKAGLTFLPFSDGPPAACRESARDLFKVDVIVPILVEGVKQACKTPSKPF